MDLSIIIVSYNVRDLLKLCLNAVIETSNKIDYEIFVVDNNSTDGTLSMIEAILPSVKVIANRQNIGFAKANNQAMRECTGDYVLLLNPDCILLKGTLTMMIGFMKKNTSIGVLGPDLLFPDGSIQPSSSATLPTLWTTFLQVFKLKLLLPQSPRFRTHLSVILGIFGEKTLRLYLDSYNNQRCDKPVDFIPGTCMLVRRKAINDVGFLDENFFLYVEDADWCFRIKQIGWRIWHHSSAAAIHYVGASSNNTFREFSPESYNSKYYYFLKALRQKKSYGSKSNCHFRFYFKNSIPSITPPHKIR